MPANPGVNPALTITALAEYAMAQISAARPAQPDPVIEPPTNRSVSSLAGAWS